jgi:NAD(P)H dehydrogenase (quinone)
MSATIAVSAASGRLGHALLPLLRDRQPPGSVIGIARNPDRIAVEGVGRRAGDYADRKGMAAALAGVDTLVMISAPVVSGTDRVALHRNVLAAAKEAGVGWVLFTSVIGNGDDLKTWFGPTQQVNRQAEEDLKSSGLDWTVGRNGLYLDLDLVHILRAEEEGRVYSNPGHDGRTGYISIAEIAAAWAHLATEPRHRGQVYNVCGEPATQAEIVAAANRVFGLHVRYQPISDEENLARFEKLMAHRGPEVARMLTGAFQCIRTGAYDVPSHFQAITGRPCRSLDGMLEDIRRQREAAAGA